MTKRQFTALLLCNLVAWTAGNGLPALLPVRATQLGAGPVFTGYYMAFANAALTAGGFAAGWLSDALQRRKVLIIAAGVAGVPLIWLMGQATSIQALALLTGAVWFLGGTWLVLLGTLTGLFAEESQRGQTFGLLGMTGAMGSLLGGLTMGPIADRWGYPVLFRVVALWWALFPLSALLLEDKAVFGDPSNRRSPAGQLSALGGRFILLLMAGLLAGVAMIVASMGRTLGMLGLGFSSAAISSIGVVRGVVSLPRAPLMGWLSDRMDRGWLMTLSCLVGATALFLLTGSTSLWQFWGSAALLPFLAVTGPMGQALVTDWVPEESLGLALSLFQATGWLGGFVGFAATGHAIQQLGMAPTFIMGAFLALTAALLLVPVRRGRCVRAVAREPL